MVAFFQKNKAELPQYFNKYLSYFEDINLNKLKIRDASFTVLDVESNGLNPKKDKILSIGAVKIINGQIDISKSFELFIDQKEYNSETAPIHGILKNGTQKKVSELEAIEKLLHYVKADIIIGHSIQFDISIINETIKKYTNSKLLNKSLDTINLYKRFMGGDFKPGKSTSLDTLSEEFNIPKSDRHNAAGDAFITAILFLKLISKLQQRGIENIRDLLKQKKILI
jgi:DNA polymerase-3 subunit epsilon